MDVENYTERVHKQSMPGPHRYLWWLGVESVHQGKCIGGALIRPVLAHADAEKILCCVETDNEMNLPFYRKNGFEVVSEGEVPKHGFRFWAMARKPRDESTRTQPTS
jgi:ribosomal protein S18 acetylase RimI-like enzyme